MSNQKYPIEIRQKIVIEYLNGKSLNQVANELNIPFGTVYEIIKKANVNRPREKGICNHDYFNQIDSPEKAYWLGFLAADGCVNYRKDKYKTKNEIILTLSSKDKEHLEIFRTDLQIQNEIHERCADTSFKEQTKSATIRFSSPKICTDLISLGVGPNKSQTLEVSNIETSLLRHYWRGMVDGDGYISISSRPQLQLGLCGTYEVCSSFLKFCRSIYPTSASVRSHYSIFQCKVTGNCAERVCETLYSNTTRFLERKYTTWKSYEQIKSNRTSTY
jgi:hypothetical protein